MSMHKDSDLSGLLPMLRLLEDYLDNIELLRRSAGDELALGPESTT
jgi:hypothetical protein